MENNNGVQVKKGAWTKEEDALLTKCIHHFGEGRWHLVPLRAGLKRCRKSCRMRWLNYLRPNLKRGCFGKDEVDLLIRLHKLLGNRWSLIAGRLPGRTANDVKNFWNSHICKKPKIASKTITTTTTTMSNIIKPQPHNLTMSRSKILGTRSVKNTKASSSFNQREMANHGSRSPLVQVEEDREFTQWWRDLLQRTENGEDGHGLSGLLDDFQVLPNT